MPLHPIPNYHLHSLTFCVRLYYTRYVSGCQSPIVNIYIDFCSRIVYNKIIKREGVIKWPHLKKC
nr:MAG TPA: hypothetical protein [Caudoviricetes sp.]